MISPEQTPAPDTSIDEQAVSDSIAETQEVKKAAIPAFSFPKPGDFAPSKAQQQPWYQKSSKHGDNKTPGPAPHGTRKTMGKR